MDEDSETDDDGEDEDDDKDNFCAIMQLLSVHNDDDILDIFKGYLAMYTHAKNGYLKPMDDVDELETNGMTYKQALSDAIVKNKEAMMFKISTCDGKTSAGDEEIGIWCKFAKERDDWESCCRWFLKHECSCEECPKLCVPKLIAWIGSVFHLMDNDDLVQDIVKIVGKGEDKIQGIHLAVEKYQDEILEMLD